MAQRVQSLDWVSREAKFALDLVMIWLKDDLEDTMTVAVESCNCCDHTTGHIYHLVVTFKASGDKVFVDYIGAGEFSVDGPTVGRSVDSVLAVLKKARLY